MTRIEIGTVVDFPGRPGYVAGTVVDIDDDYIYLSNGRKYVRDPGAHQDTIRAHVHDAFCGCED